MGCDTSYSRLRIDYLVLFPGLERPGYHAEALPGLSREPDVADMSVAWI
jgi:hypothetical protein